MERSLNGLIGYSIMAKDGELGKVAEFYFDDKNWLVRYLVVETGNWFFNKKVLLPHKVLGSVDWEKETFHVDLTTKQVADSPDVETKLTVSRQHEMELFSYYALPYYWSDLAITAPIINLQPDPVLDEEGKVIPPPKKNPHLCSSEIVDGFHIQTSEGAIGHLADFLLDDDTWTINFLVVNKHNWLPEEKMLLSPKWVDHIDWDESNIYVDLSKETIKNSPEFDPIQTIGTDFQDYKKV